MSPVSWREYLGRIASRMQRGDGRRTIFVRQPNDTGFRDDSVGPGPGFWQGQGGAVMVGLRDPALGPNLPSVPEDDPHRTVPPTWLTEDTARDSVEPYSRLLR